MSVEWKEMSNELDVIQLRCDKELADLIYAVSKATGVTPDDVASVLAWLALRPMLASQFEPVATAVVKEEK